MFDTDGNPETVFWKKVILKEINEQTTKNRQIYKEGKELIGEYFDMLLLCSTDLYAYG